MIRHKYTKIVIVVLSAITFSSCSTSAKRIDRVFTVAAPASKAWQVIGEDFASVDQWATAIPKSSPIGSDGSITG